MRSRNKHLKSITPSISLRQCYTSLYIHNGNVYPVAGSSSEIFTSAVHQMAGDMWDDAAEKLLQHDDVDITSRFYILNRLTEKGIPLKLYTSMLEAEKAIKAHAAISS